MRGFGVGAAVLMVGAAAVGCSAGPSGSPTQPSSNPAASVEASIAESTPTTSADTIVATVSRPTALECVDAMPLAGRAAQVVWPAVYGDELARRTPLFAEWGVGGAVLMTWPEGATAAQLAALKQAGALPLLIATDEEGGRVQRLEHLGVIPSAAQMAETMSPDAVEQLIAHHATAVKALGVDVVFAPVVDVAPDGGGGPIGNRVFSDDPAVVGTFADAVVRGWQSAGVLPVLKHFPGHGAATGDTHDRGATTPPLDALRQRDLLPYASLAESGAGVMVGHLDVPGLTDAERVPASLSHAAITDLLRGEYGYADALVFTDALGMKAITNSFSVPESAERAIAAGADVVIFTSTDETPLVIDRLIDAVDTGRVDEQRLDEAVVRVLAAKGIDPCHRG